MFLRVLNRASHSATQLSLEINKHSCNKVHFIFVYKALKESIDQRNKGRMLFHNDMMAASEITPSPLTVAGSDPPTSQISVVDFFFFNKYILVINPYDAECVFPHYSKNTFILINEV